MDDPGAVFLLVLAIIAMSILGGAVFGFATMILFGNLHVIFAAVPAIGFGPAVSIAWPAAFVVGAAVAAK